MPAIPQPAPPTARAWINSARSGTSSHRTERRSTMTTTKHDRARAILGIRAISALALFAIGFDHLYEYTTDHYSAIPTIGTLFLLNTIGGLALGIAVLIPTERFVPRRVSEL